MIHLIGGESALSTLRNTSVPGDKFSIDDILMEGPIIDGLRTRDSWAMRGEYMEKYFAIPRSDYLAGTDKHERILAEALQHDKIVLWYEFDLWCQINLLFLLDWFAHRDLVRTTLSLICIDRFEGRPKFRGLGELHEHELGSLFPTRKVVSAEQLNTAQAAWQAYGSPDPRDVVSFLRTDTSALPLIGPALQRHMKRLPSVQNGLGN